MKKYILALVLLFTTLFCEAQYWTPQVGIREIAIRNLPDIAIASYDSSGPVIYYNPDVCQQAGLLATAFFQAHEYGHHNLGHVIQHLLNSNNLYLQGWLNRNAENAADEFAVRYWINQGNKEIIQAGANMMFAVNNPGDQTHLPSRIRATQIASLYLQITGTYLFP